MSADDRLRYLAALQECVAIAIKYGYTPGEVATDIRLLSTPPQKGTKITLRKRF